VLDGVFVGRDITVREYEAGEARVPGFGAGDHPLRSQSPQYVMGVVAQGPAYHGADA